MASNDARRHARKVAGLADELAVRLAVLEGSSATVRLHADARPIRQGADVLDQPLATDRAMADADVEAIMIIVLMEATKSAREDLKAIMANVKKINAAEKRRSRELEKACADGAKQRRATRRGNVGADPDAALRVLLTAYGIAIEQEGEGLIRDLDSMGELGELGTLRLQMAMERLSKMMSTLSNVLKKIADTQQQIVQNLR